MIQSTGVPIRDHTKKIAKKIKLLKEKNSLSLLYQGFLYDFLKFSLQRFSEENFMEHEQHLIGYSLACLFFRIPEFQAAVLAQLDGLKKGKESTLIASHVSRFIKLRIPDNRTKQLSIFNWKEEFYDFLNQLPENKSHKENLFQTLGDEQWKRVFANRGNTLIYFIHEWMIYVSKE